MSKPVAEQVERHHHALGVPARPARAPRRRPRRLARLGLLPEHEVDRRALLLVASTRAPASQRCRATGGPAGRSPRPARTGSTRRRRSRRRRRASTSRPISSTICVDVGGGVGVGGRAACTPIASIACTRRPRTRAATSRQSRSSSLARVDDVVVDVGDVGDVGDLEARPLEVAAQHVEHEREPAVAEVRRAVDGGPAHVHRHLARLAGLEGHDAPLGGVEQVQHGRDGTGATNPARTRLPGPGQVQPAWARGYTELDDFAPTTSCITSRSASSPATPTRKPSKVR